MPHFYYSKKQELLIQGMCGNRNKVYANIKGKKVCYSKIQAKKLPAPNDFFDYKYLGEGEHSHEKAIPIPHPFAGRKHRSKVPGKLS